MPSIYFWFIGASEFFLRPFLYSYKEKNLKLLGSKITVLDLCLS